MAKTIMANKTAKNGSKIKPYIVPCISNYFIKNLKSVDNLKLNKLAYISYGLVKAGLDRELFHEPIQAWHLGPVIPSIYHEFKRFGYSDIEGYSFIYDPVTDEKAIPRIDPEDKEILEVLEWVKNVYGKMSIRELIERTHNVDTPWSKCYKEGIYNIEIEPEAIRKYYEDIIEKNGNNAI